MTTHRPVMAKEALRCLDNGEREAFFVDATLGGGGHAEVFLTAWPDMRLLAVDCDREMIERAQHRLLPFGDRIRYRCQWFDDLFLRWDGEERPSHIFFDLGISTIHYRTSGRGFSFRADEPLDMRLDDSDGQTAADLINDWGEAELKNMFQRYGEERYARLIARSIVAERQQTPFRTARQLGEGIARAVPQVRRHRRLHPATRCFLALRITINDEIERLERALPAAFSCLKVGGRIGVIAFHSLEDRVVKRLFHLLADPHWESEQPPATLLRRKPLRPEEDECLTNPPSRSARFRVAEKLRELTQADLAKLGLSPTGEEGLS